MKTHRADGVSFFSGLVITAIGVLYLLPTPSDIIDAIGSLGTWFWPVLFVAIGLAVLLPLLIPRKATGEIETP